MDIGCIGIGRMGSRMARRLVAAGHKVFVHDVNPAACAPLVALGATRCDGPDAVARQVEVVLTSVPGPAEIDAVMTGTRGIVAAVRPGTLILETSTIGPAQSRTLFERFAAVGASYLDAPVSGGVAAAETGELTAMVGGEAADFERALPVLRCLAARIHHLGPIGSGNVAKALNQMVYLSYVALFCEAARLGRQTGLDVPTLVSVLRSSVAGHPLMTGWEKHIESGDTAPGFALYRVLKDLGLGADICAEQGFDAPIFQAALAEFRGVAERGYKDKDMTALYAVPQ